MDLTDVRVKAGLLAPLPFSSKLRLCNVPVVVGLLCERTQVLVELGSERPSPVVITIVNLEDPEIAAKDNRVWDHHVMGCIGVHL